MYWLYYINTCFIFELIYAAGKERTSHAMLKYDRQKQIESVRGALALRGEIEEIVDKIYDEGFDGVYFLGIGGTLASCMQVEVHTRGKSVLPVFAESAAEYLTTGNRRITGHSVIIFSSVTGSTIEIVKAVGELKVLGCRIFGFIDNGGAELAKSCDFCITYPVNEQLKFYMAANRFMERNGEFPDYDRYNAEMEQYLPEALCDAEELADTFGEKFAAEKLAYLREHPEMPHYFIGCGNEWGAAYSYGMCYWEEQLWLRTKTVSASEFFHGTLEIIDRDTPVTLFIGEDEQRPLAERVAAFLPKVCGHITIIDTKDYLLAGISPEFRGSISHLVMRVVNNRIDVHLEQLLHHPMQIRRYYRQFDY